MGHQISTAVYPYRKSKNVIQKEGDRTAERYSDYGGGLYNPIRFVDRMLPSLAAAEDWVDQNDSGWYDQLAVSFKDGRKKCWLVKIEYHV